MHCYFRKAGNDEFAAEKAHQYGSSPSNQRIEGWWSSFSQSRANWSINFFKDMCESRVLELGNIFHMECLWFCFSKVIQNEEITGTVITSEDHVMIQLQEFLTSFITYLKIQALLIALFLFLKPK